MKTFFRKTMVLVLMISAFAMPSTSHAWFFFWLPSFSSSDKIIYDSLMQKKDWNGLLELSETHLKTNDSDPTWLVVKGFALQKLNRCAEAIPPYKRALELQEKDNNKDVRYSIGACQFELGQIDASISTHKELIGKYPDYWQAYYSIGSSYVSKRDPVSARIYLEQLKSRNMVSAETLEKSLIKPLEIKLEQEKIAAENREKEEKNRLERERQAKEDADAKLKVESEAAAEKARLAKTGAPIAPPKSLEAQLKELKQLYAKSLITKDAYETRQQELLKSH